MNFDRIGGRRFFLAFWSGNMASALQWAGELDAAGSTYALVIGATVAAYIAGNVVQRKVEVQQPKDPKS